MDWGVLPEPEVLLLLIMAAAVAGRVDAVVGGGGLIQIPALLLAFPGASPLVILATNKVSSVWGTTTAAILYARQRPLDRMALVTLCTAAGGGAVVGAALAGGIPTGLFSPLVIALMVAVTVLVVVQPGRGLQERTAAVTSGVTVSVLVIGSVVGFWDGVFGPGTGTLFTLGLVAWTGYSFLQATGLSRAANVVTNLVAIIVFTITFSRTGPAFPPEVWAIGLPMGAANVLGGWIGARTAIARGSRFVRIVFVAVVAALVVRLTWDLIR